MVCTVIEEKPRSVNGLSGYRKSNYITRIQNGFSRYNPTHQPSVGKLYGILYYFHKIDTDIDADNISKPVWDALQGKAFANDRQILLRSSGIFDLRNSALLSLDVTSLPNNVAIDLVDSITKHNHIIYIEVGTVNDTMYRFNWECHGNV